MDYKINIPAPVKKKQRRFSLDVEVLRDLDIYCEKLSEAHSHNIDENEVVETIIKQVLSSDKRFQKDLKEELASRNKPTKSEDEPATPDSRFAA